MMKCFNCKNEIEDDSLYCDQCGAKIFICPDCRIPGKGEGKKCGRCGHSLVDAAALADSAAAGSSGSDGSVVPPVPEPEKPQLPTRLVCRAENITLDLVDGALIGRVEGMYAQKLGRLDYISARHATLTRSGDCWVIADVGSRNGTAVNDQWCYTPLPFRKGDVVRIANFYDFVAE
ncbi:MAG: FHA domain-containing protein [Muribaculaceae bacterium]|nr:FHA domain-containing protein [Muribaculaceae bacterium]